MIRSPLLLSRRTPSLSTRSLRSWWPRMMGFAASVPPPAMRTPAASVTVVAKSSPHSARAPPHPRSFWLVSRSDRGGRREPQSHRFRPKICWRAEVKKHTRADLNDLSSKLGWLEHQLMRRLTEGFSRAVALLKVDPHHPALCVDNHQHTDISIELLSQCLCGIAELHLVNQARKEDLLRGSLLDQGRRIRSLKVVDIENPSATDAPTSE